MLKPILVGLMLLAFCNNTLSQFRSIPQGARAAGMAGSSVTLGDAFAWHNNCAGATYLNQNSVVASSFDYRYGMANMSSTSVLAYLPIKRWTTGIAVNKFGDQYYGETNLGIGVARKINAISVGCKINLLQTNMAETQSQYNLIAELGGIAELTPKVYLGSHIYNFTKAKRGSSEEVLPLIMQLGIRYQAHKNLNCNISVEKNSAFPNIIRAGIEYGLGKHIQIRTGVVSFPFHISLGAGVRYQRIKIDYALNNQYALGLSHQLSLVILIKKDQHQQSYEF